MLGILISSIFFDGTIYICALVLVFLLWRYNKTKDKDLIYFILSDIFYISGEMCFSILGKFTEIPIDFIFFFLFYFFIFLFFRNRTKVLLKNPVISKHAEMKTWILVMIDCLIIAILSYQFFYYFDRISLSSPLETVPFNFSLIINFLYPVLDFLVLGYYININKNYIVSDRKVYLPLIAGISIWTISDFLFAYEEMFSTATYGIGNYLQVFGLVIFILIMVLIKYSKTDSCYTTIDLYRDNSKQCNINLLMNCLIFFYIAMYLFCFIRFADSLSLMNTINGSGIILLILAILRQNIIHYDIQYRLDKISKDASTDPLTGLFSRKYAFILMQSLYQSSLYFDIDLSVLMLDIDHFKNFNDTYGHVNGDHVLKDIAQLIQNSIDISNIICRYGGEEFLLVLPGIDQAKGILIAEKIRKNIETYNFHQGRQQPSGKVTISIGGATAGNETQNEMDLVKQADAALYKAKEMRNRSAWFAAE